VGLEPDGRVILSQKCIQISDKTDAPGCNLFLVAFGCFASYIYFGMGDHYILNDDHSVTAVDLQTWAKWYEGDRTGVDHRRVADSQIGDQYWVSTVFLAIDHSFGSGPPLLFETMVFALESDGSINFADLDCRRYSTWDEAMAGHNEIVAEWTPAAVPPKELGIDATRRRNRKLRVH
jgi:hypothetical protein